ncbi:hypothetical protein [Falsiroseomonas tokyonensis]|uniref:Uncharacterized protein n=1 Tax=Falsiroseomonas tokyonensis TaxID=430521 RepID=A0ABV7C6H2_9PROT|nr:hypothetical protein [Falsiroseomonas tokyonensis]MBU8541894.1 hypothetical protein [Falsiroseomonas tokyonensis]
MTRHVRLQVNLPVDTFQALKTTAAARGLSVQALAREALDEKFGSAIPTAAEPQAEQGPGYRWKTVFLPDGSLISFTYEQKTHIATVKGNELIYDGKPTSPGEFVRVISGGPRNAWRDTWIKRPTDVGWIHARQLQAETAEQDHLSLTLIVEPTANAVGAMVEQSLVQPVELPPTAHRRFGSYPISERMGPRYLAACLGVLRIFDTRSTSPEGLEAISEAKGMFNRIVRKDRHDWQQVQQAMGNPDYAACRQAAAWLSELRGLAKNGTRLDEHLAHPTAAIVLNGLSLARLKLERDGFLPA